MRNQNAKATSRPLAAHEKYDRDARLEFLEARMKALNMIAETTDDNFVWAVRAVVKAGLAQKDLAKVLGVNQSTISRWTRKDDPQLPPHPLTREGFLNKLRFEFAEFIKREKKGEPSPAQPG
jgi:hypothetical protein